MYKLLLSIALISSDSGAPGSSRPRAPERPPWLYALEERLALRSNDKHLDQIDGRSAPEKLLPWELFLFLTRRGVALEPELREQWRAKYSARAAAVGIDDLWGTLERLAPEYLSRLEQARVLARNQGGASLEEHERALKNLQSSTCALRAQALRDLRRHFGTAKFDRFLYEGVAPDLVQVAVSPVASSSELRFIEGGCQ